MINNLCCKVCGGQLIQLFVLHDFPEAPRAVDNFRTEKIDFSIGHCAKCQLVQQLSKPRAEILYEEFKNDIVGEKLSSQKSEFVSFVCSFLTGEEIILEYGAGNCMVASELARKNPKIRLIANDFNLDPISGCDENVDLMPGDFHDLVLETGSVDLVYSSHVFEHLDDVNKHLSKSSDLICPGGLYVMALPNFESWLEDLNLNVFTQEHPVYPFKDDILNMFANFGFKLLRAEKHQDHSLFFCFEKSTENSPMIVSEPQSKVARVAKFTDYLNDLQENLSLLKKKHGRIIIFGANSSAQILIKMLTSLNMEVSAIVDNSLMKQGLKLFGTELNIESPKIIETLTDQDTVLVFVGVFDEEIIAQVKNINPSVSICSKELLA